MSLAIVNIRVSTNSADGFTLPRIQLIERRAAGNRQLFWIFQRHLESLLYNRMSFDGGSSGAIWKILNQIGLGSTALACNKKAVLDRHITSEELDQIVSLYKNSTPRLDPCSLGRIRGATLLPLATAAAVARTFGRSDASMSFLRAFGQQVPQSWELEEQFEEDASRGELDLALEEKLDELAFECEDKSFGEELTSMAAFNADADDETSMRNTQLAPVPREFSKELDLYIVHRTSTFAARRAGAAVVSASCENDKVWKFPPASHT